MGCKKCGGPIRGHIIVGGVERPVSSTRVNCEKCSPFFGNKKRTELKDREVWRNCIYCKKDFASESGRTFCNSCNVNRRRFSKKQFCLDYKGNRCQKCGYSKCSQALTFHHRNPEEKKFLISGSHARSNESLMKELDKCDLLCHNCHAEEHAKNNRWVSQEPEYYI